MMFGIKPLRVLVVDDDADVRNLLVHMVERFGHFADRARDGVEAIEAIEAMDEHTYDVVLLDLTMPRMTGEDVLRWLRQHPEWARDLRVVVVTASAADHRDRLEALGAQAVLPKPLLLEQFREVILGEESMHVIAD